MTTTEYIKLNVDKKSYSYAKIYASLLTDEFQRKRAYASLVALYSFVDLLEQSPYTVQKSMTLFKNPQLNEQYEISDLYVNGWHIDVRVVTGGDAVLVPKIHFDCDIAPDFYVVVKVDSTIQNAELVGVVDTQNIIKEPFDYHYDAVPFSSLISYETFLAKLVIENRETFPEEDHELFKTSYLALLDNNLDEETKKKVVKHLFKCSMCRTEFCCFTGFEMVCCNTTKYPEVLEDHTLGFVGAQNAENAKYQGKEETIYIGSDENEPEVITEAKEEVTPTETDTNVSGILDNLFDMDEGTIQEDSLETNNNIELEQEEQIENPNTENDVAVSSIDDILNEVTIDSSVVSVDNTPDIIIETTSNTEEDKELQMIDDEVFLDTPSKYPEIVTTQDGIQIIPDETVDPYTQNNNIELISDEKVSDDENTVEKQSEDEEIFVINDDEEELLTEVSDTEDSIVEEKDELLEVDSTEDTIQEIYPSDEEFKINENDEDEIESLDDEIIDEATMLSQEEPVQKVIVDYDENGEPVYSYITDIEQSDNTPTDDILIEDDEDENNDFLKYEEDENTVSEIEDISDEENDEEEYKSVYDDEDEEENIEENIQTDNNLEETDYEDDEPLEYYDDDEKEETIEQQPSIIDDILYKTSEEDDNFEEDDNKNYVDDVEGITRTDIDNNETEKNDDIENDENIESDDDMIDYNDDDVNSEEYDDEDGEYDDYDIEEHLPEEQVKKSSGPLAIIIAIILLLGLIGGGAFFFLTKGKTTQEEAVADTFNENVVEATENQAVNDMFEEPIETEQQAETTEQQGEVETPQTENQTVTEEAPVKNNDANNEMFETPAPAPAPESSENVSMPELTESDLIKPTERKSNGDANKTIVNAFATNASPVSLKALNWFCAPDLFSDINFKNYLQTVDNTLKQNLKNNFMNLVESSPKNSVAAKFAIDNRGNLKKAIISESSGSEEIDNIVLQSINETFEQGKSQILNDNELKQNMYYLRVVIKL